MDPFNFTAKVFVKAARFKTLLHIPVRSPHDKLGCATMALPVRLHEDVSRAATEHNMHFHKCSNASNPNGKLAETCLPLHSSIDQMFH